MWRRGKNGGTKSPADVSLSSYLYLSLFSFFTLMFHEKKLAKIKLLYEDFKKGNESPYQVKSEALLVLEEAKEKGLEKIIDDIEEILMDVEFSINQDKCNCNNSSC